MEEGGVHGGEHSPNPGLRSVCMSIGNAESRSKDYPERSEGTMCAPRRLCMMHAPLLA